MTGIINRYRLRNSDENFARSGAPSQSSVTLFRLVKHNRKRTLSDINRLNIHARNFTFSKRTVQRKLYSEETNKPWDELVCVSLEAGTQQTIWLPPYALSKTE